MELTELLQWVTMGRKTGSLAFVRDKTKNYIYLEEGRIISSRSNEPTKQLGHYLLFQGKITEAQLKRALELQRQTRMILGKILVQEDFLSQEELQAALVGRTEEVIYDLFLWDDGYFHFTLDGYNVDELILINIDINSVLFEGIRRKDEWRRIRQAFPSNDVLLSLRPDWDAKGMALTPLQKKLLFLTTMGKTITEMILELHGSEFQVNFELFQLHEMNIVQVREVREVPAVEEGPSALQQKGMELIKGHKYAEAIAVFQQILLTDPQNAVAEEQIEQAEKAICQELYRTTVPGNHVPYFLVPESSLMEYDLTNQEGFVASRINGSWDVNSIVMLSPLREIEILQILEKLINMKLIALK